MITVLLLVTGLFLLAYALLGVNEGYEDDQGFHPGSTRDMDAS